MMQIDWPCELSQETQQSLRNIATLVNDTNQQLGEAHWASNGVYYLTQGMATVSLPADSDSDTRYVSAVMAKGDWIGALAIERTKPLVTTITEITPVRYLFFPSVAVWKLAKSNLEIYKWLYHAASLFQPRLLRTMISEHHSRRIRVIYVLLELCSHQPLVTGALPQIKISQQQLSEICCLTRPRLNEVLKVLQEQKLLSITRGLIQVLNLAALQQEVRNI